MRYFYCVLLLACVAGCGQEKPRQSVDAVRIAELVAKIDCLQKTVIEKDAEIAILETKIDNFGHEYRTVETALMRKCKQYHEFLIQIRQPYLTGMAEHHRKSTLKGSSSSYRLVDYNEQVLRDIKIIDTAIETAGEDVRAAEQMVSESIQRYGF